MRLNSTTTEYKESQSDFDGYDTDNGWSGYHSWPPPPNNTREVGQTGCRPSILRVMVFVILAIIVVAVVFAAFIPTHEKDTKCDAPACAFLVERVGAR